jgi:small subunit ribosomal protein S17
MTEQTQTAPGKAPGKRKVLRGVVASDKMHKTLTVVVERTVRHPRYEKYVRRRAKLYAHDEHNEARIGDHVEVVETRRLSRLKRWRLVKILRRGEARDEGVQQ